MRLTSPAFRSDAHVVRAFVLFSSLCSGQKFDNNINDDEKKKKKNDDDDDELVSKCTLTQTLHIGRDDTNEENQRKD